MTTLSNIYKNLIQDRIILLFETFDKDSDYDIIKIMKEIYPYKYICSDKTRHIWWEFNNHKWKKIDEIHTLSNKLFNEITNLFSFLSAYFINENSVLSITKAIKLNKLIYDLQNNNFIDSIIRVFIDECYDEKFEEKLDNNRYLLGFDNGVYDLQKSIFRQVYQEDYISLSVGYDYKEFDENDDLVKEVYKFIEEIQPDKNMRKHMLNYITSLLDGYNTKQEFMFWTSENNNNINGRLTMIELIQHTLGNNYFEILPSTIFTKKRKSRSSVNLEITDIKRKRFYILQEQETGDKLTLKLFNKLINQNIIKVKSPYINNIEFIPQFNLCYLCKKIPKVSSNDNSLWKKISIVAFEQQFVDLPDPKKPYQHPIDIELKNKLPTWKQPFMWILLNNYDEYF